MTDLAYAGIWRMTSGAFLTQIVIGAVGLRFYMPSSSLSEEGCRQRMAADQAESLVVEPLAAPFGAIVRGLVFADQTSPETVAQVEQAIGQYQVLVFRGHQPLRDAQLAEFTRHFGVRNVKSSRQMEFTRDGYPEIVLISNVIENGKPIGTVGDKSLHWHADLAHSHHNVRFGFLDAVEVPREGGNTIFASGYAALEPLSPSQREEAAELEVYHVGPGSEYPKPGDVRGPDDPEPMRRPLVVTNPTTGRRALFLSHLRGDSRNRVVDQSRADQVEALTAHITSPRFVYEHHWEVGDLVMWDQIGLLHARHALPPERRILRQVTVKVPFPEEAMWGSAALAGTA
jgi:taurine dioxygenase